MDTLVAEEEVQEEVEWPVAADLFPTEAWHSKEQWKKLRVGRLVRVDLPAPRTYWDGREYGPATTEAGRYDGAWGRLSAMNRHGNCRVHLTNGEEISVSAWWLTEAV